MTAKMYAKSVIGALHIRQGIACQDYCYISSKVPNVQIMAIADGHGSRSCPYSGEGAYRAVHAFCDIMTEIMTEHNGDIEALRPMIDENQILAQNISALWRMRVKRKHLDEKRPKIQTSEREIARKSSVRHALEKANESTVDYSLYGTTLLGIAVAGKQALVYQIGDGDMLMVHADGIRKLVNADKFLGVETYSLAHEMSWNYAKIDVINLPEMENGPCLIMMSTDGFSNSYLNEREFYRCCQDYYDIIREDGFDSIKNDIPNWLRETSDNGCGDDITLALAYFE